jgi:hypothetical protein
MAKYYGPSQEGMNTPLCIKWEALTTFFAKGSFEKDAGSGPA